VAEAGTRLPDVRSFPTLADPHAILDEYLPEMAALLERPHLDHSAEWQALRDRLDELFTDNGWTADESRVAFDLLTAFAERAHHEEGEDHDHPHR